MHQHTCTNTHNHARKLTHPSIPTQTYVPKHTRNHKLAYTRTKICINTHWHKLKHTHKYTLTSLTISPTEMKINIFHHEGFSIFSNFPQQRPERIWRERFWATFLLSVEWQPFNFEWQSILFNFFNELSEIESMRKFSKWQRTLGMDVARTV